MEKRRINRKLLAASAVVVLMLAAVPVVMVQGLTAPPPLSPEEKIEPALLQQLDAAGSADLIVRFVEQADLTPAFYMGWRERGDFVYSALTKTAQRSQAAVKAYLDSVGLSYRTFIVGNELYVWGGDLAAVQSLSERPEVATIRATRTYYLDPIVSVDQASAPQATLAWGIADSKAHQFWTSFGVQGDGIIVAGIDTGVQYNHPALDQSYRCAADPSSPACWYDPSDICAGDLPCDNNGHGTHTMGTMVADDDASLTWTAGMAPNAQWIACKGCEEDSCSDFALLECADWLVAPGGDPANRPHVVNNSWGGGAGQCNTWYLAKVNAWRAAGIFPAFSAGNDGELGCGTLGNPGVYQESFATAAHDSSRAIAFFSSRGPAPGGGCNPSVPYTKPNISAPGVNICSTVPGNGWSCGYSGTSMASPHTAGAVALLWSCNPSLIGQIDQTFQLLQNSADTPPAGGCGAPGDPAVSNYTFGYGYLNVLAAGNLACVPPATPTPTFTPLPPVTPNAFANLPLLPKSFFTGPAVTPTPTPGPGWQTIVWEDFEGTFPGVWDVFDDIPGYGEYFWGKRNCRPFSGSYSGWGVGGGANGSALPCGSNYPDHTESWMMYGPFSLADASQATLSFQLWLNSELGFDHVCRLASINGSNFYGTCTSGDTSGWTSRVLDLANVPTLGNLIGQPNVWIALIFDSDGSIHYAEGGYVDEVLLRKYVGTGAAGVPISGPAPGGGWVEEEVSITIPDAKR